MAQIYTNQFNTVVQYDQFSNKLHLKSDIRNIPQLNNLRNNLSLLMIDFNNFDRNAISRQEFADYANIKINQAIREADELWYMKMEQILDINIMTGSPIVDIKMK